MSDPNNALTWIAYAEEDLAIAKSALRRKKPITTGAYFHTQQCAEKYLKAALISNGKDFPKTHDLLALNTLCEQSGIFLGLSLAQLSELSAYASRARYPGDEPTVDEARKAVDIAKTIRRFVRKWLGIK